MIVWKASNDQNDVWTDSVRVGEVGGNSLGFLGCQLGSNGNKLLGYSFNGALHLWNFEEEDDRWEPGVAAGGHFGPVQDLDWERSGRYVVNLSV